MAIQNRLVDYRDGDLVFEGRLAWNDAVSGQRPGILVAHAYGNTAHAFTNPAANDREGGTVYDAVADRRSWTAMQNFLDELFNGRPARE